MTPNIHTQIETSKKLKRKIAGILRDKTMDEKLMYNPNYKKMSLFKLKSNE